MGWIFRDRRGQEWKQNWAEQALAGTAALPIPLLIIITVTVILVMLTTYFDYKSRMERTMMNLEVYLFMFLLLFILAVHFIWSFRDSGPRSSSSYNSRSQLDASPLWVAAAVVFLLVLLSFQNSAKSIWFRLALPRDKISWIFFF